MSIFECDIERELKLIRQDEFNAGLSQGFNQGRTEGLSQGFSQGRTEGISQGITETKKKMALKMLKMGKLTIEEIAEYSELSIAEIEHLAELQTV